MSKTPLKIDTGYESMWLDYDPESYKTISGAAKGLYKALIKFLIDTGCSKETAEREVIIRTPEENANFGYSKAWYVAFEGGIYEWAHAASWSITGSWGYSEPYHSFDLTFYEN